jgi:diguanylate cyclase (GGDEF)-like protein
MNQFTLIDGLPPVARMRLSNGYQPGGGAGRPLWQGEEAVAEEDARSGAKRAEARGTGSYGGHRGDSSDDGISSAPLLALHERLLGCHELNLLLEEFLNWLRQHDLAEGLRLLQNDPATGRSASTARVERILGTAGGHHSVFEIELGGEPRTGLHIQHCVPLNETEQTLLGRAMHCLGRHLHLVRTLQQLHAMALHDPLTGLHNRKALEERLQGELARARRHQSPLSVLAIDVDHFKQINDRYGHQGGDRVLCALAEVFRETVRDADLLFRQGGDEFIILLPETGAEQAHCLAQRLRAALATHAWPALGTNAGGLQRTPAPDISIGVAQYREGDSAEELLHRADGRLYSVKQNGRGGVSGRG